MNNYEKKCSKLCLTKEKIIVIFLFLPTAIFFLFSIYILFCRLFIFLKLFYLNKKRVTEVINIKDDHVDDDKYLSIDNNYEEKENSNFKTMNNEIISLAYDIFRKFSLFFSKKKNHSFFIFFKGKVQN